MRWHLGMAAALVAACAAPGWAQFRDLIREAERLAIERDQPVTLSLQCVPAKEVVEKLAEATQAKLTCAPALAEKKVSVVARERSARQVGEGLARAVGGRWRKEGNGFVLEPCDRLEVLKPEELASEFRTLFLQPGGPPVVTTEQAERSLLGIFAPDQLEAMAGVEGISLARLAPQQQRHFSWLIGRRSSEHLSFLGHMSTKLARIDGASVASRGNELVVRWPHGDVWQIYMPPKRR